MKKILHSIGFFMIGFGASCLSFYLFTGGAITLDRYIVAAIIGLVVAVVWGR